MEGCQQITVYTDHRSVTTFLSQENLTGRKARWAERLSPFANCLRILHAPGNTNRVDGLSRRRDLLLHTCSTSRSPFLQQMQQSYKQDPLYNGEWRLPGHIYKDNELFYTDNKLCVPNPHVLRNKIDLLKIILIPTALNLLIPISSFSFLGFVRIPTTHHSPILRGSVERNGLRTMYGIVIINVGMSYVDYKRETPNLLTAIIT